MKDMLLSGRQQRRLRKLRLRRLVVAALKDFQTDFRNHHALLLSKASGWRNHAFFHVHGAKKEDNCAPRGKHASAPHRPALPLPAIRLASASHARSSFRPPLAWSMHASPNAPRESATEPW